MSFQEYSESLRSKLKIGAINKKLVFGLVAVAIASLVFGIYTVFIANATNQNDSEEIKIESTEESDYADENAENGNSVIGNKMVYVHVAGCVKSAGMYCVPEGSRIDDVIKAAGGFTKSADKTAINLAEVISDEQQIIVPKKTKANLSGSGADTSSLQKKASDGDINTSNGLVNINSATSEQLQTLSGIGEAKAKKIIDYREQNGRFSSVEELTNITGIGEKTLESIRSYICV